MGIKGTVRRTTDGHLIHANIDTDIIISEEPPTGSTRKPDELYHVIERFAQGMLLIPLHNHAVQVLAVVYLLVNYCRISVSAYKLQLLITLLCSGYMVFVFACV